MNESRKTGKLQTIINLIEKRFSSMNKGSKLLVKIASFVLLAFVTGALFLTVTDITGVIRIKGQVQLVQWVILYAFRTWALLFSGALILDYLKGGEKQK